MTHSMSSHVGLIMHFHTLEISDSSVITHHYVTRRLKEVQASAHTFLHSSCFDEHGMRYHSDDGVLKCMHMVDYDGVAIMKVLCLSSVEWRSGTHTERERG